MVIDLKILIVYVFAYLVTRYIYNSKARGDVIFKKLRDNPIIHSV